MVQWKAHDETTATSVLGVEREGSVHQHDDTAAKEQAETKPLCEHIDFGEFLKDEVGLVGWNARTRVLDGEVHDIVSGFDAHGDAALAGEVEGVDEQLCEDDEQVMTVGLKGQFIAHMAVKMHLHGMWHQTAGCFDGFVCQHIAAHGFVDDDGLTALDKRCCEQLVHHIVEGVGLHVHGLSHLLFLVIRKYVSLAQYLGESMYDVEWRMYLVGDVLHELCLLLACTPCQQGGLFQFLGALLSLLFRLLCIIDVLADALPHLAETVLQLAYQVGALTMWQERFIVAVAYLPQFGCQQSQGLGEVFHDAVATYCQQEQSDDEQGHQNVVQAVVSSKQFIGGTDERYAPLGAFERSVEHDV